MLFQEKDFIISQSNKHQNVNSFITEQEAPSNIALVKYWGKYGLQLPMNPSISFTLNKSKTITKATAVLLPEPTKQTSFKFYFDNKHKPDFEPKIAAFFERIQKFAPYINDYYWRFDSHNTFPHSSGIASSASGFAALAKIIIELEKKLNPNQTKDYYLNKTSFLARLGSGSASRSVQHPVMLWGKHPEIPNTSNLYAIPVNFKIHPVFENFQDSIILVEKGQKPVSSTVGHQLMNKHPYKEIRKKQAFDNTLKMYQILQKGDLHAFLTLVEAEALSLHALMMTSDPNYILMQPDTLQIIHQVRKIRTEKNIPVSFTLDAGANVHVLYPKKEKKILQNTFFNQIKKEIIHDYIG